MNDLCPHCAVELFVSKLITWLHGLPSCGYEMQHMHDADYGEPKALFVWKVYPHGVYAEDMDRVMFDRRLAMRP